MNISISQIEIVPSINLIIIKKQLLPNTKKKNKHLIIFIQC